MGSSFFARPIPGAPGSWSYTAPMGGGLTRRLQVGV